VLNDASIILADLATGQEIERWEVPRPEMVQGQPWLLPRHAFRPDGRLLALGTPRGSIFFRDLATGEQIHKLAGPDMPVALLAFSPEGRTMACAYRDATVLIWDVASVSPKRRPAATDPMDKYWLDLLMGEAPEAWKAHWAMANSTQTVSFLRERLRPVRPADLGPLAQKVRELDSPRFAMRERAMKALEAMGLPAEPGLRQALKSASSPETQRRLEQLLAKLVAAQHRQLQELRAVAILEQIASVEANQVLEAAAGGDPQAPLTIAAQAACKRLRKE
jgi:hypothetical protein